MNLIPKIFRPAEKKSAGITDKEDRIFYHGVGEFGSREFSSVAAALRAGFVISGGMGMLPLRVEGPDASDLVRLINDEPNDLMTGVEFKEMMTLHALYVGAGRAYIRRNALGSPVELIPLAPDWCGPWVFKDGEYVLPVSIEREGVYGDFKRDDILEITSPRWNMLSGLNVTSACGRVLGLTRRLQDRQAQFADTKAPYGVLFVKDGQGQESVKRLKRSWAEQFGKTGIAVVDMDGDFQQLVQSSSDQQLIETMKFQIEEIARMYGVHPYYLMQTAGSGAQGAVSDVMLFHQANTMAPWITRWEAGLRRSLFKGRRGVPNFDENALMRTTPQVRAEIYARALGSGGNKPWMTEDEVRKGESPFNLPEMGDEYWQSIQEGQDNDAPV
ncbi:MAG: phage portal protein [Pikeienuella sp.]